MQIEFSRYWYNKSLHPLMCLLLPFSWLFGLCALIRRKLYRAGMLKIQRFQVPVIIAGNITVGGTGKTPFVIWLAKFLKAQGYKPGIVSRGVGGNKHHKPHVVTSEDTAQIAGDEALLLRQNSGCPVVLCIDRAAAVRELVQRSKCDIVISDDGLQHYRLGRDLEIVVVDGVRRFGNHRLLPAGPLREPVTRLRNVDFVLVNGGTANDEFIMELEPVQLVSVRDPSRKKSLAEFENKNIHAVAGIGHPERFFSLLKINGFNMLTHVFPDHHLYQSSDLDFNDTRPILMTEKDAVKCGAFADDRYWYLDINAKMNAQFERQLLSRLKNLEVCNEYENDFGKNGKNSSRDFAGRMQCDDNGSSGCQSE